MDSKLDTMHIIRNSACVACGAAFKRPRAGKLYCSPRCKQFAYYHKSDVAEMQDAKKGLNSLPEKINLKEYESYLKMWNNASEYFKLKKRKDSEYLSFEPPDAKRFKQLEKRLPQYIKQLDMPHLSIENWSYLRLLFPALGTDEFIKVISNLEQSFFENLIPVEANTRATEKTNPIKAVYQNHLLKIVEGKITFA
jgi:hypothetical protein